MNRKIRALIWSAGIVIGLAAIGAVLIAPPKNAAGLNETNSQKAPSLGASPARPLRILIIGGTSGIGLETTRLALARGHEVRVMSRRGRIEPSFTPAPQVVQGDIRDPAAVAEALRDVDAVIVSVSVPPGREPVSVFSDGVRNVLQANPARILFVSGIGAGDSRGHGGFGHDHVILPMLLAENYADKDRAEALLRASTVDWTIVRPGFLNDAPPELRYHVVSDMRGVRSGSLARADVAHYLIAALESGLDSRRTVLLSN